MGSLNLHKLNEFIIFFSYYCTISDKTIAKNKQIGIYGRKKILFYPNLMRIHNLLRCIWSPFIHTMNRSHCIRVDNVIPTISNVQNSTNLVILSKQQGTTKCSLTSSSQVNFTQYFHRQWKHNFY